MQAINGTLSFEKSKWVVETKPGGAVSHISAGVKVVMLDGVVLEHERDLSPDELERATTDLAGFDATIRNLALEAVAAYEVYIAPPEAESAAAKESKS